MRKAVGSLIVSLDDQTIWRDGSLIKVTPKAASIFCYLTEKAGRLVTHDELLANVWPQTTIQPEALKVYIFELRRTLGDDIKNPDYIETVPRRGYRLIAPVSDLPIEIPASTEVTGREETLQHLLTALQETRNGSRRLVFVTGEAGVGKTAVIQEFLFRAQTLPDVHIARGQSLNLHSKQEPFYPVLEALSRLEIRGFQRTLESHAPAWLARLPSLWPDRNWMRASTAWMGVPPERMLREICELLEQISANRTVVLVLEDLHWADEATVDFLSVCARRSERANILLVCSFRRAFFTHVHSPVAVLSRELGIKQLCQIVDLGPLPTPAIHGMLARHFDKELLTDNLVGRISAYAGGNPLYVLTILKQFQVDRLNPSASATELPLPQPLRELILTGYDSLSAMQQRLTECGTQVGFRFSAWEVSVVSGIQEEDVAAECEILAGEPGVLRDAGIQEILPGRQSECFEFRHRLLQDAIASRVQPSERARGKRLLAEAIARESDRDQPMRGRLAFPALGGKQNS
jgi:DNA-binding winged helix-turn-helix (wHTH) protein